MNRALEIHHDLAAVAPKPSGEGKATRLKKMIGSALDQYRIKDRIPAKVVHDVMRERHGEHYRTAGYYLRIYRRRAELTQVALARRAGIRQRHLSEMENNTRAIGAVDARKLAEILDCDQRMFL